MMAQVIGFLLLAAVALYALKVAILMLFLVGIIFRTKATLSLIFVLGVLALFRNYPIACIVIVVVAAGIALSRMNKASNDTSEPAPELTDETGS